MGASAKPSVQPSFGLKLPDRYGVGRHIATGGMASVWCAEDRVLGRPVAIKVLSERFADDELAVRRFQREARAAARVSAHPHVVTIFDVGEIEPDGGGAGSAGRAFIVMEHLAGGTVAQALRAGAVSRTEARRWLREAAAALDHAHQRGIVHRDIKPANFLLDQDRILHVADFGIARLQSEDTITGSNELFGTAGYLAPEQALGHEATSASDRYALAVAAFELLTGGRPFSASHFTAQARQHIEDEPPRASERDATLPRAVDDVLRRGMSKAPDARYETAGAFVDALETALDSEPTVATRGLDPEPTVATRELDPEPAAATRGRDREPGALGPDGRSPRPRTRPERRPPPVAIAAPPRQRGRGAALAALAVVAVGVIVLITQLQGGSGSSLRTAAAPPHPAATAAARRRTTTHAATSTSTATSSSASASSTSTAPTTGASVAPAGSSATGETLQLQGHQQMLAGNYPAAISTLRQALASTPPTNLYYAYALYDLGRSLLLSGDPKAAVGVLEQRLQIPDQTAIVQQTLNQALSASGQSAAAPSATNSGAVAANPGASGSGPPGPSHSGGHHGGGGGSD